ncbi:hypothetical protein [Candidatus Blastococcus massiliensis]|uniref:hypothetical protein n=1 Tax=Candidatus Blastococcus massiliensis TaxID=1470358 RepID=UPI0004ADD2C5|nr:hypothetical protein [Candidatus Blastococcus massiliensis]
MTERDQSFGGASAASGPPTDTTTPVYSAEPVAVRGPSSLAGLLLILAGIAAAISLVLDWVDGEDTTALDLVREGFEDLGGIVDNGLWQPMAVVLGGGVLLVLGILMWLPARSHRFLGLLGLIVSGLVTWAVLVPLYEADWELAVFGPGFWCAIAVAVLGLLGSLKALLTGKRYR